MKSLAAALIAAASIAAFAQSPAERIDAKLAPLFRADEPGATVILTVDGKTVFRKAYGVADYEKQVPLKPEDVMRLASVSKQFTAAAIMLLEQDGKLSVDDDLAKYVPEFPAADKPTTLRHLLNHTSGIVNLTSMPAFPALRDRDATTAEVMAFFKDEPRRFAPGAQHEYSNSGYFLLGVVVERVSGMSFPDFLAQRIFEPLGMKSTAYEGYERDGPKRVEGYARQLGQKPVQARPISMAWASGAGSLVSNVDDLAAWDRAITEGKLLTKENWARMFVPPKIEWNLSTYAFGFIASIRYGYPTIWHNGLIEGFQTVAMRFPEERAYAVVLMNMVGATTSSGLVLERLVEGYFGK